MTDWWGPRKQPVEVSASSTCDPMTSGTYGPPPFDIGATSGTPWFGPWLPLGCQHEPFMEEVHLSAKRRCWYCGTRITVVMDSHPCPGCNARDWDRQ